MASAHPLRADTPQAPPEPPVLRLLERRAPPLHALPPPAPWHARLGHWVDRLLVP
jgi:hypothetical protein